MNVELLEKVITKIHQEPQYLDMNDFHSPCGTTHCIGGWAQMIVEGHTYNRSGEEGICHFAKLLDLDYGNDKYISEGTEADRLFFVGNWPEQFVESYSAAEASEDKQVAANVTVERIRHFIATNVAE